MPVGNVENVWALLEFPLRLHMAYTRGMSDGKLDLSDLGLTVEPFMALPKAIQAITSGEALAELKDLDDVEREGLYRRVKDLYDIADDKLEQTVEDAIKLGMDIGAFLIKVIN